LRRISEHVAPKGWIFEHFSDSAAYKCLVVVGVGETDTGLNVTLVQVIKRPYVPIFAEKRDSAFKRCPRRKIGENEIGIFVHWIVYVKLEGAIPAVVALNFGTIQIPTNAKIES